MRNYEVMYIIRPDLEQEPQQAIIEKLAGIITAGGEISKQEVMGKRRLAYEINKFRDGVYVLVHFKAGSETVSELDRVMRISDEIIRYMIVNDVVA